MKKLVLTAAMPFAVLMMMGAASAQDAAPATTPAPTQDAAQTDTQAPAKDLTLGELTVPAAQIPVVEDWCKELQAQQGLTGTNEPESTMTQEQADAATAQQGEANEDNIDLSTVTLEQCQEAGLTDQEGE